MSRLTACLLASRGGGWASVSMITVALSDWKTRDLIELARWYVRVLACWHVGMWACWHVCSGEVWVPSALFPLHAVEVIQITFLSWG